MGKGDDDRFRVKPAAPRRGSGERPERFVSSVLAQVSKAGVVGTRTRPASTFGRGRVAAGRTGGALAAKARRVVVKSRYVVLKRAGARSVETHLRYIERGGVTRDGQHGRAYDSSIDEVDLKAFEERGRGDRHQFRFIVSVEDAESLEDLRAFTRELMKRMAADLETPLDWVAVDHWDTDNPHTHVVLRGRAGSGQDLVISPDYMAHGMRLRASGLATEWLGPRTELEMQQSMQREVTREGLTGLDRGLLRRAVGMEVDLTAGVAGPGSWQILLRARLQRLQDMELAQRLDANRWRLAPGMEATLKAMGERGDILRTMHKALKGRRRECTTQELGLEAPIVGCILAKGLADEMRDDGYLVVDGVDGQAHYARVPASSGWAQLPIGGIVEVSAAGQQRGQVGDHHHAAEEGASRGGALSGEPGNGLSARLLSALSLEMQVRASGPTWLDSLALAGNGSLASTGFGSATRSLLRERLEFLADLGLVEVRGQRAVPRNDLLDKLRDRELRQAAGAVEAELGRPCRALANGERVTGFYRRSLQLTSGRFALLDDGAGFRLVPWNDDVEPHVGQKLSVFARGHAVTWQRAQLRSPSL